jgi:hypothetical protein
MRLDERGPSGGPLYRGVSWGTAVVVLFALGGPAGAADLVIDDFSTAQGPVSQGTTFSTANDFVDGAGILQTERNLRVSAGADVSGGPLTAQVSGGTFTFNRPGATLGQIDMWWDGDNSTATFSPTGLGGIDLTAGGRDRFRIPVVSSSSASLQMRIIVWTDGTNLSQRDFTLPTGGGTVELLFSSFTVAAGTGGDFTNVGAIFINTILNTGAWTATLGTLRAAEPDTDGDGIVDSLDNCPTVDNPGQENQDGDALGDVCDPDRDGDGVANASDNCPTTPNPGQEDSNLNGVGDACELSVVEVPTLGPGGVVILTLLLAGAAALQRRKRRSRRS